MFEYVANATGPRGLFEARLAIFHSDEGGGTAAIGDQHSREVKARFPVWLEERDGSAWQ